MNRNRTQLGLALAALLAAVLVGCADKKQTARVSGHVTLDGELVTTGTVTFSPVESGEIATGSIRPDGNYTLHVGRATGDKGGLPPGEYKVTVSSRMPPVEGITERGGPPDPGTPITPSRYLSPKTTPLSCTVKPGDNVYDIPLKRDAGEPADVETANDEPADDVKMDEEPGEAADDEKTGPEETSEQDNATTTNDEDAE